jgi:hypothetical protein
MIQRHVGPRLSNLSDDGQVAGLRPTSGGLHSSGRGTEPLVSPPPLTDALRRGYDQWTVTCQTAQTPIYRLLQDLLLRLRTALLC